MRNLFLIIVLFFICTPAFAHAAVIVNEVMYDLGTVADTNHEWVELYNNGTASVDLTGYKFFDGSNHVLNPPPSNGGSGTIVIPANGYFILSGKASVFLSDHKGYAGTVIDTVMNLKNMSSTIKLIGADGAVVDELAYNNGMGAAGDGKTLSRFGNSWSGEMPTPGQENIRSVKKEAVVSNENSSPTGNASPSSSSNKHTVSPTAPTVASPVQIVSLPPPYSSKKISNNQSAVKAPNEINTPILSSNQASVPDSFSLKKDKASDNFLPWLAFGALVIIGGVAVFLLRKKEVPTPADEFTIVE